jgi:hypothetical protein
MTELFEGSGNGPMTGDVRQERRAPRFAGLDPEDRRSKFGRSVRGLIVGVLAVTLLSVPSVGFAGEKAAEVSKESGLGAAAAVSSLIYGPVKLVWAAGGLIVGSLAWVFTAGDTEVASTVYTRSLRGDYVITPGILLGEEPLEFIGRDSEPYRAKTEAVASADIPTVVDDSGYDEMGW